SISPWSAHTATGSFTATSNRRPCSSTTAVAWRLEISDSRNPQARRAAWATPKPATAGQNRRPHHRRPRLRYRREGYYPFARKGRKRGRLAFHTERNGRASP